MSQASTEAEGRRRVELVVLSDLHLGTVGCQAKPLLRYLKSIEPGTLVLNGDIIDCWQFSRWYWPKGHMKVVKRILKTVASGTPVYYVTGNHDEMLRRFAELHLGNFYLVNKVVLDLDGRRAWIFHGDVFDVVMQHSRWLVKLGSRGYDLLILINRVANWLSERAGRGRISLSKRIKDGVKRAVSFIGDFERTAAALAGRGDRARGGGRKPLAAGGRRAAPDGPPLIAGPGGAAPRRLFAAPSWNLPRFPRVLRDVNQEPRGARPRGSRAGVGETAAGSLFPGVSPGRMGVSGRNRRAPGAERGEAGWASSWNFGPPRGSTRTSSRGRSWRRLRRWLR